MRALKRLNAIADMIEYAEIVADIGCDHGYLGKMLIKSGKAGKVIATDINKQSLAKAERLAKKCHIQDKIETMIGDGLIPIINMKVDTVVIAGLGGQSIVNILKAKPKVDVKQFIFQPAQKSYILKQYLQENKFKIICDFIVKDKNKFYNTIKAVKTDCNFKISEEQKLFCLTDFDQYNEDLIEYVDLFIDRISEIIETEKSQIAKHQMNIALKFREKLLKN